MKIKTKTFYFKKLNGVDGINWYWVDSKKDIKYLGSSNSKYTSNIVLFRKNLRENYNIEPKIIYVGGLSRLEKLNKFKKMNDFEKSNFINNTMNNNYSRLEKLNKFKKMNDVEKSNFVDKNMY